MEFGSKNGHVPVTKVHGASAGEDFGGVPNLCQQCGHDEEDHDFIIEDARAPIEMGRCMLEGCACARFEVKGTNNGKG